MANPGLLAAGLAAKALWFTGFFLFLGGAFGPELRRSLRQLGQEATSGLWLAVGLVFGLGAVVAAFLWTVESRTVWWHSAYRYAVVAAPILLWLLFREGRPLFPAASEGRAWRRAVTSRFALFVPLFLAIDVGLAAFAAPYGHVAGLQGLNGLLRPGDVVGVHGLPPDLVLPYVPERVSVVPYRPGFEGAFLVSASEGHYEVFTLMGEYGGRDLLGDFYVFRVWIRGAALE